MNTIFFNRLNCYEDLSCILLTGYDIPVTCEDIENINVDNRRQGSLTIKTGNYKDLELNLTFRLVNYINLGENIKKIINWISDIKDNRLYFSNRVDKVYLVKNAVISNFKNDNKLFQEFSINFICEPFMAFPVELIEEVNNNSMILNKGDIVSDPILKLTLPSSEQTIQLTINSETLELRNVSNYIEINSQLFLVTGAEGESQSIKMYGDFPVLNPGYNSISWNGNIVKFEIQKNTRFKA